MKYEIQERYLALKPLVENVAEHFAQSDEVIHKARNEIRLVTFAGETYVVKAFRVPNLINRFIYRYVRASKARRSYRHSIRIGPEFCPEAVAYIENYKSGLLETSYFISRHFAADYTIRSVLREQAFANRTAVLEQFAAFTFLLHENKVLHKDYSPGNVLIKEAGGQYQFRIVDVNRMVFRALNLKERAHNFVKFMMEDEMSRVVLSQYALRAGVEPEAFMADYRRCYDRFIRRKQLKNKLRGR